jgi:hypothetical protein
MNKNKSLRVLSFKLVIYLSDLISLKILSFRPNNCIILHRDFHSLSCLWAKHAFQFQMSNDGFRGIESDLRDEDFWTFLMIECSDNQVTIRFSIRVISRGWWPENNAQKHIENVDRCFHDHEINKSVMIIPSGIETPSVTRQAKGIEKRRKLKVASL